MTSPNFNVNDTILWDRKKWRVKNVDSDNKLYELNLDNPKDNTTSHGTGGYMDISKIDETATLVTSSQKGGLKRSLKNRRSLNKRRSYRRRVKTIRRK